MGLIMHKGVPYGGGSDVVPNPQDAATDELEKLGIDGDVYEVTDADYRSNMHTFTTTDYNSTTHKFEGGETSMSYAVKSIFSPLKNVFNALKTAINDHAGVFTTISNAVADINTALTRKVDKGTVLFNELRASGHKFGDTWIISTDFTATSDVSNENTNLTAIKTVVNNLADYTEENVQVESVDDTTPYLYRKSPAIGTRVMENALVGASVVKNQLVQNGDFASADGWSGDNVTVSNGYAEIVASSTNYYQLVSPATPQPFILNRVYLLCANLQSIIGLVSGTTNIDLRIGGSSISKQVWAINKNGIANNEKIDLSFIIKAPSNAIDGNNRLYFSVRNTTTGSFTIRWRDINCIDLTQMFGTSIADYVYSLEQATAGSGIAWLKSHGFFTKDYYPYNTGELISVKTSGKKYVGFNQWDESLYLEATGWQKSGDYYTGTISSLYNKYGNGMWLNEYNYDGQMCISFTGYMSGGSSGRFEIIYTDGTRSSALLPSTETTVTTISTSGKVVDKISVNYGSGGTVYIKNTCINFSKTEGTPKNGDYIPYEEHTYDISNIDLRGIPKLVNNELVYDGDTYESNGDVTRKYGVVDLGSLTWSRYQFGSIYAFYANITDRKGVTCKGMCSLYIVTRNGTLENLANKELTLGANATYIYIRDDSYTDATTFKTAMSGVYLIYELATPTTETTDPYTNPQICDKDGTEEFIDDRTVPVPVGHESEYKALPALFEDDYIQTIQERAENVIGEIEDITPISGTATVTLLHEEDQGEDWIVGFTGEINGKFDTDHFDYYLTARYTHAYNTGIQILNMNNCTDGDYVNIWQTGTVFDFSVDGGVTVDISVTPTKLTFAVNCIGDSIFGIYSSSETTGAVKYLITPARKG